MKPRDKFFILGFAWWLLLALAAVLTGVVRDAACARAFGDPARAYALSSFILIVLVWALAYLYLRLTRYTYGTGELWGLGAAWLLMTVAFEFLFGRFAAGKTWAQLFADYNLLAGRTWPLVLLAVLVAPLVTGRLALNARKGEKKV